MNKKGFTLIELLVVIAIIGVLSSIVLASLNNSRQRAADATIKTELVNIRSSAEIYYNGAGSESYGVQSYSSSCGSVSGGVFGDSNVQTLVDDAILKSGQSSAKCRAGTSSGIPYYVIAVPLASNSANAWCVDNTGVSKQILWTALISSNTSCP